VLTYHVLSGTYHAADLSNGEQIPTVEKQNVTVTIIRGTVFIDEARVLFPDNEASNGVVHIVDQVLLPQGAPSAVARATKKAALRAGSH